MNILVRTYSGQTIVRPDTTCERDSEDLYVPGFVDALSFTPVLAARIIKPGRSVSARFARRYYDPEGLGAGLLLYPEDLLRSGHEEAFATASCLDHTSFLPMPERNSLKLGSFTVSRQTSVRDQFFLDPEMSVEMLEQAIEEVTKMCYIRTGDLICIELSPRKMLAERGDGSLEVKAELNGETVLDFRIIF